MKILTLVTFLLTFIISFDSIKSQAQWEKIQSPIGANIEDFIFFDNKYMMIMMPWSGVQLSEDFGETWNYYNDGLEEPISEKAKFFIGNRDTVFLLQRNILYEFSKSSSRWQRINYPDFNLNKVQMTLNGDILFSSSYEVYISKDNGKTHSKLINNVEWTNSIYNILFLGNNENYFIKYIYNNKKYTLNRFSDDGSKIELLIELPKYLDLLYHVEGGLLLHSQDSCYRYNAIKNSIELIYNIQQPNKPILGSLYMNNQGHIISNNPQSFISFDGAYTWTPILVNSFNDKTQYKNFFYYDSKIFYLDRLGSSNDLLKEEEINSNIVSTFSNFRLACNNDLIVSSNGDIISGIGNSYKLYNYNYVITTNRGINWEPILISGKPIRQLLKWEDYKYFATTSEGVFYTQDNFQNWKLLNPFSYNAIHVSRDGFIYYLTSDPYSLTRSNLAGDSISIFSVNTCCDGGLLQVLSHPNGNKYVNWSGRLGVQKDNQGSFNFPNFKWAIDGYYQMNSKSEIFYIGLHYFYKMDSELNNIDSSNLILINSSSIVGSDNQNRVYVYCNEHGLYQCESMNCIPFNIQGLPFPNMKIQHFIEGEDGYYYIGLANGSIYRYTERVATSEIKHKNSINIYPNPMMEYFIIDTKHYSGQVKNLTVIDAYGKIYYQSNLLNEITEVSTIEWSKGVYFIGVDNVYFEKVIKN